MIAHALYLAAGLVLAALAALGGAGIMVGLGLLRVPSDRPLPDGAGVRAVARASVPAAIGRHRADDDALVATR